MALPFDCYCGKETLQVKCSDNPQKGVSCNQPCGRVLSCAKHVCEQTCHPGPCEDCTQTEEQTCYCGKETRTVGCGQGTPKWTMLDDQEAFGYFECDRACERELDCGHHTCSKGCHPQDAEAGECLLAPSRVTTCPCGKRPIVEGERTSCMDPIPACDAVCDKRLPCNHACPSICHTGECPSCVIKLATKCSCGACTVHVTCGNRDTEAKCDRPCNQKKNCGKHRCTNRCCKEEHFCTLLCNKKLRCGVHTCQLLCHKGYCPPCLEATFHEMECNCGRTRLFPPIACGVKLPACPHPCKRRRPCGHAQSAHNCHPDDESCPVCTHFVERACLCGKSVMANVPCYKSVVVCGAICNKPLACGGHVCNRVCHDGPCLLEDCKQTCGKLLACNHRCKQNCHVPELCPSKCDQMVQATCACGLVVRTKACSDTITIPCTLLCEQAKRNRLLREALGIERDVVPVVDYNDYLLEFNQVDGAFVRKMESLLGDFIQQDKSVLHLQPMKRPQRQFIHHLCEHYNIHTKSVDEEPHRSVILYKTPESQLPLVLLSHVPHNAPTATPCSATIVRPPMNALLLRHLEFATTDDRITTTLQGCGITNAQLTWLSDDEILLTFPNTQEATIKHLYATLSPHFRHICCCHVNDQGHVEWPKSKKALPRHVAHQIALDLSKNDTLSMNSFAVLTGE